MNTELYNWLVREFKFNNLKKYHKYCESWISNLTEGQIIGFQKQMTQVDNNAFIAQ